MQSLGIRRTVLASLALVAAHQIGAGLGALGAGIVRTELATYTPAWVAAGLICLVAAVIVLLIGRGPRNIGAARA